MRYQRVSLIVFLICLLGLPAFIAAQSTQTRLYVPLVRKASPPSAPIAFISGDTTGDERSLFLYYPETTEIRPFLELDPNTITSPAWSPDGNRIAVVFNYSQIYTIDANGSNFTRFTHVGTINIAPSWSPDGKWIVFSSNAFGKTDEINIYKMRTNGSELTRLTTSPISGTNPNDYFPKWSPDGQYILFESKRLGSEKQIFIMNADGTNLKRLPTPGACAWAPAWSPDGEHIAFGVGCDVFNSNLYTMNLDGSNIRQRTFNNEGSFASWSPDGQWIAISNYGQLTLVSIVTGQIVPVKRLGEENSFPAWSPK
jgi:TolB protein